MLSCPYQNSNENENKHEKTGEKSLPLTAVADQLIQFKGDRLYPPRGTTGFSYLPTVLQLHLGVILISTYSNEKVDLNN